MEYNKDLVMDAWKEAVSTGKVDRSCLRPEVADAWERCIALKVDPWSTKWVEQDMALLDRIRTRYSGVMEAASPVMQYLLTVFNCNISIATEEAFVFDLVTPLTSYPRTLGTYVTESTNGNGNITMALHDRKPSRADGYEHFRAIAQSYSGVAALMNIGNETFVLCMNDPFGQLPKNALDTCISAASLIEKLAISSRREVFSLLSSATLFESLLMHENDVVIVTDQDGMLLSANKEANNFVPGFEKFPYASKSLGEYLKNKIDLVKLLSAAEQAGIGEDYTFKLKGKAGGKSLKLSRSKQINLINGMKHYVFVFENPLAQADENEEQPVRELNDSSECVGESPQWRGIVSSIDDVAGFRSNVMITGETGTGKEIVAKLIHKKSGRQGEFVAVNCGALPKDLLASEMFGYEGGAFTGARSSGAKGKFEYATGGTLFLDEIGDMPLEMQVSLLRVLQEQNVTRIGSNKSIPIDVRVIAATNKDMQQLIADGKFRSDLWYRLSVIEIELPPLRERTGDITLLADYYNTKLAESLNIAWHPLSSDVLNFLNSYSWPGNVRELKNAMEKALISANGRSLAREFFPKYLGINKTAEKKFSDEELSKPTAVSDDPLKNIEGLKPKEIRNRIERAKIVAVLESEKGNISRSAKKLKMSRNTLYRKIKLMDIKLSVQAQSTDDQ